MKLKFTQLEDDIVDKDELCDQYKKKLGVLETEIKEMNESNESLLLKIKKYEDSGALLPDDDGIESPESQTQKMQHEIMRLSSELKMASTHIQQIRDLPSLPKEIIAILGAEEQKSMLNESSDSAIKTALLNASDLTQFEEADSFYLTESEVSQIMDNTKVMREQLHDNGKSNEKLKKEITALQEELNTALKEEKINVEEIALKIANDKIRVKKELWDEEKMMILKDLQNRVDKVVRLEINLDQAQENIRKMEATMGSGDKPLRKKIAQLERNVQQLTLMYHQVVSEKSVIKVDFQVAEKKMQRKEEKILTLEKTMSKLRDQNLQLKTILNKVKTQMKDGKLKTSKRGLDSHSMTGATSSSRIVKTIKGGGGRRNETPRHSNSQAKNLIDAILNKKD